jgi:hypothetical protein
VSQTLDERFAAAEAGFRNPAPPRSKPSRKRKWTFTFIAMAALPILIVGVLAAQSALERVFTGEPVRYSSSESKYSIEFPAAPKVTRQSTTQDGHTFESVTASAESNGVYVVTTTELTEVVPAADVPFLIQRNVLQVAEQLGGRPVENRTVTVSGVQAAKGTLTSEAGLDYRFVVLYNGSTQFIILSTMNDDADSDAFVESLRFTD